MVSNLTQYTTLLHSQVSGYAKLPGATYLLFTVLLCVPTAQEVPPEPVHTAAPEESAQRRHERQPDRTSQPSPTEDDPYHCMSLGRRAEHCQPAPLNRPEEELPMEARCCPQLHLTPHSDTFALP